MLIIQGLLTTKGIAMKKSILMPVLSVALCLSSANIYAAGGHGGGGSGGKNNGKMACKTTQIKSAKPAHLSDVAPGSEISFRVTGIDEDEVKFVEVTAKKIPVEITHEVRGEIIWFKGNLPDSLVDTAARVHVEVNLKKCPAEKGWLLKISE